MGTSREPARTSREPASVILPTRTWGTVCDQLAAQVHGDDELLVVCDNENDPVAGHDPPENVEILVAGEPERCAAKANAVACGMERASNDRFVWSDDDYEHGEDWLDRLVARGEVVGPAAVQAFLPGEGWWWRAFEPVGMLLLGLQNGIFWGDESGGYPWGGGVTFTRDELDGEVDELVADLRRCMSDDDVLHEYVGDAHLLQSMQVEVPVDGGFRDTWRRLTRWFRAGHVRDDYTGMFLGSIVLAVLGLLFPFVVAPLIVVLAGLGYAAVGYRRWTFLLAYHGLLLLPFVFGVGIFRKEVTWGDRRYRINDLYDVEVLSDGR